MSVQPTAIVGLGVSELSRQFVAHAGRLARDSIVAALADAGLSVDTLDGLLINMSPVAGRDVHDVFGLTLQQALGIQQLRFISVVESEGASVGTMLRVADMWIREEGLRAVACVFADTPILPRRGGSQAFSKGTAGFSGVEGLDEVYGVFGAPVQYALMASRYLHETGGTEHDLANVTRSNRQWAAINPAAFQRQVLTIDEYLATRYVSTPLRLVDCAFPVNGSAAVVVASSAVAAGTRAMPVVVSGRGQGHSPAGWQPASSFAGTTAARRAGDIAFAAAGMDRGDVDVVEIYDPFSFVAPLLLEEYGFCESGSAWSLYATGATAPGGARPVNTGGGQTASHYLQGMTPLLEGLRQLRGEADDRQVEGVDVAFVSMCGGLLEQHSCLLMTRGR